ncbi:MULTISPECIES: ABC transporter permease [Halomonadaceae]|uniref:ABC transporter permease n=1 Tax=Halomonadaceae TaxID=28256 RepID=UPI0015974F2D|nr:MULTISPECIES: ABC transporter permease [Halomonas]QJQ94376.1 ABC transporter permease [Halomonas sp. PA5]
MRDEAIPPANSVILVLMTLGLMALWMLDLVSVQPNRIAPGEGVGLLGVAGPGGAALVTALPLAGMALAWRPRRAQLRALLAMAAAGLLLLPWAMSATAALLIDPELPHARLGIGSGTWGLLFVLLLALVELWNRLTLTMKWRWLLGLSLLVSLMLAIASGGLDALSLVREYHGRSGQFGAAVRYHLGLVGAAVGISLAVAALLALSMRRWTSLQKGVFGLLSVIQTIPSLALFGLLLAPLAYLAARFDWLADLGVRGIGWAPALIALIGYSLLPMTRNTFVALEGVAPGIIESARGMGMSPLQVFWQVRLPLALPVMLEGIRITAVQAIGLAAVAALIGAGGLGTFIFQGLGQAAMDLVLLGALPIIFMALIVDAAMNGLATYLRRGRAHA